MKHARGTLYWTNADRSQVRSVLRRSGISGELITVALGMLMHPSWSYGPHIYIIDTGMDKGARVTAQGAEEYDVKVSSHTGTELFDALYAHEESYGLPRKYWVLDHILVLGG